MAKLLLAEDDQAISMLERDYLEMEGYEITAVDNGQAAITEALKGEYDLILLDLMLPGCNGYDVCRLIRDKIDIPILMVTTRTESVDKVRGQLRRVLGRTTTSPSLLTRRSWWPVSNPIWPAMPGLPAARRNRKPSRLGISASCPRAGRSLKGTRRSRCPTGSSPC